MKTNSAFGQLKSREFLILFLVLGFSLVLRLAFINEPFERDEGQYATIGQVILRGGLPYRDAVEIKPPGVFYLYAAAIGLFGATTQAVRIFTALYALLTVLAVYGVARLSAGTKAGLSAAFVYGLFSTFPLLQGSSSNTEVFLVLPLTVAMWFLLKAFETGRRLYIVGVGVCGACALLIKPVALPVVALLCIYVFFIRSSAFRWKEFAINLIAVLAPMVAAAGITLAYFYLRGGLDDLLYWTTEFPRRYKGAQVHGPQLVYVLTFLKDSLIAPALLGVTSAIWYAASGRNARSVLPVAMILAVCAAILLPGKNFPHYFISIVPFFAIPAGIGLAHVSDMAWKGKYVLLVVAVALCGYAVVKNYKYYTEYSPETVSIMKYGVTFVDAASVAEYLKERTSSDDYIFQWGLEPELYFLSDRRNPNPYLVSLVPTWSKNPIEEIGKLVTSLLEKRPKYIIMQDEWIAQPGYIEIYQLVQSYYHLETVMGQGYYKFRLFRLNGT